MVLRSVWKCYFTNIVSYSSLLQLTAVKYASYFQFSFERKSFWKLSVLILFTHDQCCLMNDSWEVSCSLQPHLRYFSQCLLCEHTEFWGRLCVVSLQFGFRFFFFWILVNMKSKRKRDFLRSSSAVFSQLEFLRELETVRSLSSHKGSRRWHIMSFFLYKSSKNWQMWLW